MAELKRQQNNSKQLAKDMSHFKRSLASGVASAIEADLTQLTRKFRKLYNLRMKA